MKWKFALILLKSRILKGALSRILHAKARSRLLTSRRNAAIPPRSRVQMIARITVLSRVLTLRKRTRTRSCRPSSDAPPSLPFWCVFPQAASLCKHMPEWQTGRGIRRGSANTRLNSVAKR